MHELDDIAQIEARYAGPNGQPALGDALLLLLQRWGSGARDRETALRLMFLAWYSCAEPAHLTGLPTEGLAVREILTETMNALGGPSSSDAEALWVMSIMVEFEPWLWGDPSTWASIGIQLRQRALQLRPQGFTPELFAGRGAYGEYFAHLARRGAGAA
jgi:hypothetical protein